MRTALIAIALCTATNATAAPTWADWVGDYTGSLRWSACSVPGAKTATLAIDAVDGVVSIDLAAAGGGLGRLALVEDGDDASGWMAQQGDTLVHVRRSRADTVDVIVELDSGCTLRANLSRSVSPIAACTRLAAWARIEARCTKLSAPPLEDRVKLGVERTRWDAARGDARTRLASSCDARSDRVAHALVEAGCAPNPDLALIHGSTCQALGTVGARLARCARIPPATQRSIQALVTQLVGAAQTVDAASKDALDAQCRSATDAVTQIGQKLGCW